MRNIWIIFKREMMVYFFSAIAYLVAVCLLVVKGIEFSLIVTHLSEGYSSHAPMTMFFGWLLNWFVLLVIAPVITMRLFADEKRMGTIETLMTTPLRDVEYVLAKFFSALCFFSLLWMPTITYVFVLRYFAQDTTPLDLGPIMGGYLGVFMIGGLLISIGCAASACSRNQIVAAIISFAIGFSLFLGGIFFYYAISGPNRDLFEYFAIYEHMLELARGSLEWKRVVFYLSGVIFFLFITHRIVQARQWKT